MESRMCPNCGNEIAEAAEICEHCQMGRSKEKTAQDAQSTRLAAAGGWIGISAAGCFIIILVTTWASEKLSFALPSWTGILFPYVLQTLVLVVPFSGILSILLMIWYGIRKQRIQFKASMESCFVTAVILILAAISLPWLAAGRQIQSPPDRLCQSYLRQLGMIADMYAYDNGGQYPFIDNVKNNFIFEGDLLYPELLTSPEILACPMDPNYHPSLNFKLASNERHPEFQPGDVHPDCFTDFSYCYLGWIVTSDEEMEAFLEAYDRLSPENYDKDITVADGRGNGGGSVIYRLDKKLFTTASDGYHKYPGIFLIGSGKWGRDIPIMWDKPSLKKSEFSHRRYRNRPPYGNVVYLDGHVEEIPFPGKFPMTETMARLLDERPRAPIPDCDG